MKKINVIITSEYWKEVIDIFKLLNQSEKILKNRLEKIFVDWNLNYLQFLILKKFYPSFFNDYNVSYYRFSNSITIKINLEEYIVLANKYKDFYNLKTDKVKDFNIVLLKYFDFFQNNKLSEDFYLFFYYLFFSHLWFTINKKDNFWLIKIRPMIHIPIQPEKATMDKIYVKENINKVIWYYLENYWWDEVVIVGKDTINSTMYDVLCNYCTSNSIKVSFINKTSDYSFWFNVKIFLFQENYFYKNFRYFFSYRWNVLLLI